MGGLPPLVGVAVKVTGVPAHIVLEGVEILTLTGKNGFTIIFTVFEIAGLPVAHMALEVSSQVTASLTDGL